MKLKPKIEPSSLLAKAQQLSPKSPSNRQSTVYDKFLQDESLNSISKAAAQPRAHAKEEAQRQLEYQNYLNQQNDQNEMLIQDQNLKRAQEEREALDRMRPSLPESGTGILETSVGGDLFDDDQRYYESVSVDLEQEEFNKLQYYKSIINHVLESADCSDQAIRRVANLQKELDSHPPRPSKQKKSAHAKNIKTASSKSKQGEGRGKPPIGGPPNFDYFYGSTPQQPRVSRKKDKNQRRLVEQQHHNVQSEFLQEYPTNIIEYEVFENEQGSSDENKMENNKHFTFGLGSNIQMP